MPYRIVSQATEEPITLAQARLHLKMDTEGSPPTNPDDTLVESLITAVRQWAEGYTGRTLAQKTVEYVLDEFPAGEIELPVGPAVSVTSVGYVDEDGIDQIVSSADYSLDPYSTVPRIVLAGDAEWPTADEQVNAVKIRYVTGFSMSTDSPVDNPIPKTITSAMLLMLHDLYTNRGPSPGADQYNPPNGVRYLLDLERIRKGMA